MVDYFKIINAPAHMTKDEKIFLSYVTAALPQGSLVVEVGTYTGGSAYLIGLASEGRCRIVSLDINVPADLSLLEKVGAEFFHGDAARYRAERDEPIDLLFIDGDHSFSGARVDYETLSPLVKPAGLVSLHDFDFPHFGVKLFGDTLLRTGCLKQWHASQRLLLGRHNPERLPPSAADYAATVELLMQVYDNSDYCKGWKKMEQALENIFFPISASFENVYIVRSSPRCLFLHYFYNIDRSRYISPEEASDTKAMYYVCTYDVDKALEVLRVHKRIPNDQIKVFNDFHVSYQILQDLVANKGEKCLRVARNEMEREIISMAFLNLSEARLYRLHETGFLHYFFYNLGNRQ